MAPKHRDGHEIAVVGLTFSEALYHLLMSKLRSLATGLHMRIQPLLIVTSPLASHETTADKKVAAFLGALVVGMYARPYLSVAARNTD